MRIIDFRNMFCAMVVYVSLAFQKWECTGSCS